MKKIFLLLLIATIILVPAKSSATDISTPDVNTTPQMSGDAQFLYNMLTNIMGIKELNFLRSSDSQVNSVLCAKFNDITHDFEVGDYDDYELVATSDNGLSDKYAYHSLKFKEMDYSNDQTVRTYNLYWEIDGTKSIEAIYKVFDAIVADLHSMGVRITYTKYAKTTPYESVLEQLTEMGAYDAEGFFTKDGVRYQIALAYNNDNFDLENFIMIGLYHEK